MKNAAIFTTIWQHLKKCLYAILDLNTRYYNLYITVHLQKVNFSILNARDVPMVPLKMRKSQLVLSNGGHLCHLHAI